MKKTKCKNMMATIAMLFAMTFVLPLQMAAQTQTIKMTTSKEVGDFVQLGFTESEDVVIEGAEKLPEEYEIENVTYSYYRLMQQTVTIKGNVTSLDCSTNQLSELELSECNALTSLICDNNELTILNVNECSALTKLSCNNNQISELNMSECSTLEALNCSSNLLRSLDLANNIFLVSLVCDNNQLSTLDLSQNLWLKALTCYANQLQTIDLSMNPNLIVLRCNNNQLQTLDLSKNTQLEALSCDKNRLTALNLNANTNLSQIACFDNPLTVASAKSIIENLPEKHNQDAEIRVNPDNVEGHFTFTYREVMAATQKGWMILDVFQELYAGAFVPANTYSTLCFNHPLDFTGIEGLEAYSVTDCDLANGRVMLKKVDRACANMGLIIKATPGNKYILQFSEEEPNMLQNWLIGVIWDTELNAVDGTFVNYVLKDGKFVKVDGSATGNARKLPAGKAYLTLDADGQPGYGPFAKALHFVFEGETTGIANLSTSNAEAQPLDAWYTLDGRRMAKPTAKGVYVRNGKKVIF